MNTKVYEYIRHTGLEASDVAFILFGAFFLLFPVWAYRKVMTPGWARQHLTYNDLFGAVGGVFIGVVCFLMVYWGIYDRYLLREGAYRYTVARVVEYGTRRGYRKFVYQYEVAGQLQQSSEDCGVSRNRALPCPPIGTRLYVQFSPEDPSVDRVTQLEVPDTVRRIPPRGWARLP